MEEKLLSAVLLSKHVKSQKPTTKSNQNSDGKSDSNQNNFSEHQRDTTINSCSTFVNSTSSSKKLLLQSVEILKKLSLIDFQESNDLTELFKRALLDFLQTFPLKNMEQVGAFVDLAVLFVQCWHCKMGPQASWPHTRTCFYYLEDKIKKNNCIELANKVLYKRLILEPNKKQALSGQFISTLYSSDDSNSLWTSKVQKLIRHFQNLQKQNDKHLVEGSFAEFEPSHSEQKDQNLNLSSSLQQQSLKSKLRVQSENILYIDSEENWQQLSVLIEQIKQTIEQKELQSGNRLYELIEGLKSTFEVYSVERLPALINSLEKQRVGTEQTLKQLLMRKQVVEKIEFNQSGSLSLPLFSRHERQLEHYSKNQVQR